MKSLEEIVENKIALLIGYLATTNKMLYLYLWKGKQKSGLSSLVAINSVVNS